MEAVRMFNATGRAIVTNALNLLQQWAYIGGDIAKKSILGHEITRSRPHRLEFLSRRQLLERTLALYDSSSRLLACIQCDLCCSRTCLSCEISPGKEGSEQSYMN
jgi:hypothetical protein